MGFSSCRTGGAAPDSIETKEILNHILRQDGGNATPKTPIAKGNASRHDVPLSNRIDNAAIL
jgi:hypothetical protein